MDVSSFVGVWSRVQLFEPMLSDSSIDDTSLVLWLQVPAASCWQTAMHTTPLTQAPSGEFVDLRWIGQLGKSRLATDWNARDFKSFAGLGSCQHVAGSSDCTFTWQRHVDYRPAGPPDVGRMVFLDQQNDVLQEDGVLPGDDYREIWRRLDGTAQNSFGGRCFLPGSPDALGFYVVSGKYVGVAVRCAPSYSDVDGVPLANIFTDSDRCPSASEQDALDNYFGVIACDGVVVCCSRPIWTGKSVHATVLHCIPQCNMAPPAPRHFHSLHSHHVGICQGPRGPEFTVQHVVCGSKLN